jgi:hypothetical protein
MTFGPGVRAQVFEVVVRQAIAGAPWREICAGPMQINNIDPGEVEYEVDRRLNRGKNRLPHDVQQSLTKYIAAWEETVNTGKADHTVPVAELIAAVYADLGLETPKVISCDSPAQVFYCLLLLSRSNRQNGENSVASIDELATNASELFAVDQTTSFIRSLMEKASEISLEKLNGSGEQLCSFVHNFYSMELPHEIDNQFTTALNDSAALYFKWGFKLTVEVFLHRLRTTYDVAMSGIPFAMMTDYKFADISGNIETTSAQIERLVEKQNAMLEEPGQKVLRHQMRQQVGIIAPENQTRIAPAHILQQNRLGIWDPSQLLAYGFAREHLSDKTHFPPDVTRKLDNWLNLFKAAPWYSFYENVCFVVQYPQTVTVDIQFRPSNTSGPAIVFADGFRSYALDGIAAPRKFIESPELLTPTDIESVANVTLRRRMIESYGVAKFLADADAILVESDKYGKLYRKELPGDEDLAMVAVINTTMEPDGTYKEYFLRVPPTMQTALEAVAWTFGMTAEEYAPSVES